MITIFPFFLPTFFSRRHWRRLRSGLGCLCTLGFCAPGGAGEAAPRSNPPERAFPGAEGWAATTPGGRGGQVLRVTTLARDGAGSFLEAAAAKGPRIIVFEVGGVIDLAGTTLTIKEPFLTIAGQTAPSPGITFIRGGFLIAAHDVVVQHIRVRPGEAGHAKASGWEPDGMSVQQQAHHVIVDHCSFTWGIDENLSTSSKPFEGAGPEDWRKHPAQQVTFSHNIIAEGLNKATHSKVAHSKGTLIMDNCSDILILENLYADNVERNPQIKGGSWTTIVNNYIYNPGVTAIHYHLNDALWKGRPRLVGKSTIVGNVLRHGPDTLANLALVRFVGQGDLELYTEDNLAVDRTGRPVPIVYEDNRYGGKIRPQTDRFYWPAGLQPRPAATVQASVLQNAGARPWDRDEIDRRIVRQSADGTGKVIDSETEVGGYPAPKETRQPFDPAAWDLRTMTRRQ